MTQKEIRIAFLGSLLGLRLFEKTQVEALAQDLQTFSQELKNFSAKADFSDAPRKPILESFDKVLNGPGIEKFPHMQKANYEAFAEDMATAGLNLETFSTLLNEAEKSENPIFVNFEDCKMISDRIVLPLTVINRLTEFARDGKEGTITILGTAKNPKQLNLIRDAVETVLGSFTGESDEDQPAALTLAIRELHKILSTDKSPAYQTLSGNNKNVVREIEAIKKPLDDADQTKKNATAKSLAYIKLNSREALNRIRESENGIKTASMHFELKELSENQTILAEAIEFLMKSK